METRLQTTRPVCGYLSLSFQTLPDRLTGDCLLPNMPAKKRNFVDRVQIGGQAMKNNRGFSLLELLIVVAIILIIATIAIPSLLRSRQSAHEAAAVATLRTLNTAEVTYLTTANGKFGGLTDLIANQMLSSNFSPGPVSGY